MKKKLLYLTLGIILFIIYSKILNYAFGTVCTLKLFTGYPCPSCGMTRALEEILHLNFSESLKMHPLLIMIIIGLIILLFNKFLDKKCGKLLIVYGIITLVTFIIVYIIRMIYYFPNNEPLVYYDNNILKLLKELIRDIK